LQAVRDIPLYRYAAPQKMPVKNRWADRLTDSGLKRHVMYATKHPAETATPAK
jgi:hypothetical protein